MKTEIKNSEERMDVKANKISLTIKPKRRWRLVWQSEKLRRIEVQAPGLQLFKKVVQAHLENNLIQVHG